jgi:hypothetical protein
MTKRIGLLGYAEDCAATIVMQEKKHTAATTQPANARPLRPVFCNFIIAPRGDSLVVRAYREA